MELKELSYCKKLEKEYFELFGKKLEIDYPKMKGIDNTLGEEIKFERMQVRVRSGKIVDTVFIKQMWDAIGDPVKFSEYAWVNNFSFSVCEKVIPLTRYQMYYYCGRKTVVAKGKTYLFNKEKYVQNAKILSDSK